MAVSLGIPVKVNIDSGRKPNGVPERRRTAVGAKRRWHGDCRVSVRNRQAKLSGAKRRQVRRGLGVQGKGAAVPLPLLPRCRIRDSWGALPNISANLSCLGLKWHANFREARLNKAALRQTLSRARCQRYV